MGYARSPIQDFTSCLRFVAGLDDVDIFCKTIQFKIYHL